MPDLVEPWKAKNVPRPSAQVKLYWPPGDRDIWEKFLEICDRDGHGASAEIRDWVKAQVEKRNPGNPQKPLEPFQSPSLLCKHKFAWIRQPAPHLDQELWRCKLCGVKAK